MSHIQYPGASYANFSTNSGMVAVGRGSLVNVNVNGPAGSCAAVWDNGSGAVIAGGLAAISSLNAPFEPTIPTAYFNGLWCQTSTATQVTVSFIPHMPPTK